MRLGIYGGSFDPIHYGHLLLAECCREQARLDEVWFVPASIPPHKRSAGLATEKDRVEMLHLAIAGQGSLRVSTKEIDRGGVSYTVDTLREIHTERPHDELFLLVGADTLEDLPHWRAPAEILDLATPIAVARHGSPPPDFRALEAIVSPLRPRALERIIVEMPIVAFSSSDLRERIRTGRSIRFRTPRAVEKYIETHDLYRA